MAGPTSTDDIPDKTVTRQKLGKGGIVSILTQQLQGQINDGALQYATINLGTANDATEPNEQTPAPLSGKLSVLILNILSNNLTGNLVLTVRKNGADTSDIITIKPSDLGTKSYPLSTEFNALDLLNFKTVGNGNGSLISINSYTVIEYDG